MPAPSSTPTDAAVRTAGLSKTYGAVRALDGVGVELPPGELVGIVGPNGSGKSTLLKVLAGIVAEDEGTVEVLGMHPRRGRATLRARTAYAGQEVALDPEITGRETLRLFHALQGLPRRERGACLATAAERAGLAPFADRPVGTWSGGQRQRLHLALATLHGPELLMLDEPAGPLDPEGRRELWGQLSAWRDADPRNTALVATHDLADVAAHCDRVLLLHEGRLAAAGSPAALVAEHARARTVVALAGEDGAEGLDAALAALPGVREVRVDGATVVVWRDAHPDGDDPVLRLLASGGRTIRRFERHEPELADAYFRLTGSRWAVPELASAAPGPGTGAGGGRRRRA